MTNYLRHYEKWLDKSLLAIVTNGVFFTNGESITTALLRMSSSPGTLEEIYFVSFYILEFTEIPTAAVLQKVLCNNLS